MAPVDLANFLAGKAVAAATSYLDGRSDGAALALAADRLRLDLLAVETDPDCNGVVDPTRMMVVAMMHGAVSTGPRQARWHAVMTAFVDLVRTESLSLADQRRTRVS
jgi:hypothetical protein